MNSFMPFSFTNPYSIDIYIGSLLAFAIVSLLVRVLIKKAWKTRIGAISFFGLLITGVILVYAKIYSIGLIFILVFAYVVFVVLSTTDRSKKGGPDHEE